MKIEFQRNTLDNQKWWFELGISVQQINFNKQKWLVTIGLTFFNIYIRW